MFALCSEQVLIVRPLKYRKCQIQSYSHAREEQYIVLHMYIRTVNKSTQVKVQLTVALYSIYEANQSKSL